MTSHQMMSLSGISPNDVSRNGVLLKMSAHQLLKSGDPLMAFEVLQRLCRHEASIKVLRFKRYKLQFGAKRR